MYTNQHTGMTHKYGRGLRPFNYHRPHVKLSQHLMQPHVFIPGFAPPDTFLAGASIPDDQCYVIPPGDGNYQWGNCFQAAIVHKDQADHADAGRPPTTLNAVSLYSEITGFDPNDPSTDQGTDPIGGLNWLVKQGYIAAWALVDRRELILPAAAAFNGLIIGAAMPDNSDDQFESGNGFAFDPDSPRPGYADHAMFLGGYNGWRIETWGRRVPATPDWMNACVLQYYALFNRDQLTEAGLSALGLNADTLLAAIEVVRKG